MKLVKDRIKNLIYLMAVEPIRRGDTLKEAPAKQRQGVATTFF